MIEKATNNDVKAIYRQWKENFDFDDNGTIDFYFENLFNLNETISLKKDEKIVSSLQLRRRDVYLNGYKLAVALILGVVTDKKYRHQGYMKDIMTEALNQSDHQYLFTFIQAYDPTLYEQFGFKEIYYRKKYLFKRNDFARYPTMGINQGANSDDMAKCYLKFCKKFDGYMTRDEKYFALYRKQIISEQGDVFSYHNELGECEGYAVCYYNSTCVMVDEIIYNSVPALLSLISYICSKKPEVSIEVSQGENLHKIIPTATVEKLYSMMVRINNIGLFNKLYNTQIRTVEEAFSLSEKPLFLHEWR